MKNPNEINENDTNLDEENTQQENEQKPSAAELERDALAKQMESELVADEMEDFDPDSALDAVADLPPEVQQAAIKQVSDLLVTDEGATAAVADAIDNFESVVQEYGHEKFSIKENKKKSGVKRLTPLLQKYAPDALQMLGKYKDEALAALWVGSLAFTSVRQVKAFKKADAIELQKQESEQGPEAKAA